MKWKIFEKVWGICISDSKEQVNDVSKREDFGVSFTEVQNRSQMHENGMESVE